MENLNSLRTTIRDLRIMWYVPFEVHVLLGFSIDKNGVTFHLLFVQRRPEKEALCKMSLLAAWLAQGEVFL